MTTAEVKNLSLEEKLRLMESLWLDLREHAVAADIPEAHKRLLDERRARAESGEVALHDWDDVKDSIGKP